MIQRYHLLIQSPFGTESLIHPHPFGWLLPVSSGMPSIRPTEVLAHALGKLGLCGVPTAVTYGSYSSRNHEVDWLGVVVTPDRTVARDLEWRSTSELDRRSGVCDFQQAALRRYVREPETALGFDWPQRARDWIDEQLGERGIQTMGPLWVFRCSPCYVGARYETNRAPVYFKAVPPGRGFAEAAISRWLWELAPDSFVRTLAMDLDGGRWVGEHVDGVPLRKALSTGVLETIITTVAAQQIRCADRVDELRALGAWAATLDEIERDGIQLVEQSGVGETSVADRTNGPLASPHETVSIIAETVRRVKRLGLPEVWIPLDLVPDNIIVSRGRPVFIDVGECWIGPAPAALEVLFQGMRGGQLAVPPVHPDRWDPLRRLFAESWSSAVAVDDMRAGQTLMPLIVFMVQSLRGLRLLRWRVSQGEIAGLEEHSRRLVARRLMQFAAAQASAVA